MKRIKEAGIAIGAVAGGIIGGAVSLAGKLSKVEVIEELGDGIVDSAILTGGLVGEALSGTADMVSGGIKKDAKRVAEGKREIKHAAKTTIGNAVHNIGMIGESGVEIAGGLARGDSEKALKGIKTLAKMAAIGLVTVGAVKISHKEEKTPEDTDVGEV